MTDPVLTSAAGRSVLRMERLIGHPPEEVWRSLVEPERLAVWFPAPAEFDLRVGGEARFGFGGPGTVTDLDPPRLLAFTWETDHLRFELTPEGDGSRLLLVHTFDDRGGAASFAAGWSACLAVLAGEPEPDTDPLHERYLVAFGLLEPVVDGDTARYERQLLHKADAVWPALVALTAGAEVRESREPEVLELELPGGGRERWEFNEGTGHGARLVVTRTAPPDALDPAAVPPRVEQVLAGIG